MSLNAADTPEASAHGVAQQGSKPNIVIIFTDDQGYGDRGCYGSTLVSMRSDRSFHGETA